MLTKHFLPSAGLMAGLTMAAARLCGADTPAAPTPAPTQGTAPAAPAPAAPAKPDTSKLPAPAAQPNLTYDKDILPMFKESCGACHLTERPKGGMNLASATTALKTARGKVEIIPGKSEDSPLVWYVADLVPRKEMPPTKDREKNKPLTKDQIALLRAWIDQGAK